jgi:hypothetical protein
MAIFNSMSSISLETLHASDVLSVLTRILSGNPHRAPSMDLYKAIQDLYTEKEKLERVIASLEELQKSAGEAATAPKPFRRRGRKSMSNTERQEVSTRMKKYWESRRKRQEEKSSASTGHHG